MVVTLAGVGALAAAGSYPALSMAAAVIGFGSATFHPEASRVARMASGGRFGTAQSAFQVGGNTGSALGPIVASIVILPFGQTAVGWLAFAAIAPIWVLFLLTRWRFREAAAPPVAARPSPASPAHPRHITRPLLVS